MRIADLHFKSPRVKFVEPPHPRSPYGTRPLRLNTADKAITELWKEFQDCFADLLPLRGGGIAAEDDPSEVRELYRLVVWRCPREFCIDENFRTGAKQFELFGL